MKRVLAVGCLLALAAACDGPGTNGHDGPSQSSEPSVAPNLIGLRVRDAKAALRLDDLRIVITRKFSRKVAGSVLRQLPAPGAVLDALSVTVVVAKPIPFVPDVTFDGLHHARAKLKAKGYRVRVLDSSDPGSQLLDAGTVLDYQPSGRVRPGRRITLHVARGPEPTRSPGCDPNYADGCVPKASDVDCGGGSGNGPEYVWETVRVVGVDVYDLDGDNDGYGCE